MGVAMVMVMLVGAGLTVVASGAAFVTVRELRAGTDDRKAAEALAIAEAGIDRFVELIRGGTLTWGEIRLAGCDAAHPSLQVEGGVGNGTYQAVFSAYNPFGADSTARAAPAACTESENNPRSDSPKTKQWFAITSTGQHPTATRVVRQVVQVGVLGLPVGIYSEDIDGQGSGDFRGISMITPGDLTGREKMSFEGTDPFYKLADFWPGMSDELFAPAAVHTLGTMYLKKDNSNQVEHPPNPNCLANGPQGTSGQSLWDQSGRGGNVTATCSNWPGSPAGTDGPPAGAFPTTSLITSLDNVIPRPDLSDQDYLTLRATAKREGLYCKIEANGVRTCTRLNASWLPTGSGTTVRVDDPDVLGNGSTIPALPNDFVAYFEFVDASAAMTSNIVNWRAPVGPCSDTLADNRSAVIVIRNGSYDGDDGDTVNGLILAPEGELTTRGGHTIHGTVITKSVDISGTAEFQLDSCWVRNMPGPFLDVTPQRWSEVDR
jgi:hypothetical protein